MLYDILTKYTESVSFPPIILAMKFGSLVLGVWASLCWWNDSRTTSSTLTTCNPTRQRQTSRWLFKSSILGSKPSRWARDCVAICNKSCFSMLFSNKPPSEPERTCDSSGWRERQVHICEFGNGRVDDKDWELIATPCSHRETNIICIWLSVDVACGLSCTPPPSTAERSAVGPQTDGRHHDHFRRFFRNSHRCWRQPSRRSSLCMLCVFIRSQTQWILHFLKLRERFSIYQSHARTRALSLSGLRCLWRPVVEQPQSALILPKILVNAISTHSTSLAAIANNMVYRWLRARSGRNPRVLVGNKMDVHSANRVDLQDVQLVAEKLGAPHVETSARDNVNIDTALSLLVQEIRRKRWGGVIDMSRMNEFVDAVREQSLGEDNGSLNGHSSSYLTYTRARGEFSPSLILC